MGVVGRLFGLGFAVSISIFLISSFSMGVVALQDTNNDSKINIIDMVMSLNKNLVRGDTNNDAKVNIFDLAAVGLAFGSKKGDPSWNPDADVANTVDVIDIFDLATVGKNFDIQNADSPVLDPPISVAPSSQTVNPGDSFNVNITIDSPVGIYAFEIIFVFNPSVINATAAVEGNFLKKDGAATYPLISIDNTQGKISIANTRFGVTTEVTGAGNLATISFKALNKGTSKLDLASATLVNSNLQTIAGVTTNNGTVTVGAGCTTHDHFACFDDDVYWYDSCDVKEEKKGECGSDYCDAWGANYCKSGNVYHSRTCNDRGCSNNACFDNTGTDEQLVQACQYGCSNEQCIIPQCFKNSDCGTDGWVDSPTCSSDDVYQTYRTYTCSNPGTADASCSHADALALKQDCGIDSCDAWGANYCKAGNVYHSRTCHDRGCSGAACFDNTNTEEELVGTCQYGCSVGECVVPSCMQNSDCGTDGLVGGLFCSSDDVFQAYRTYTCSNPGTGSSSCSHVDTPTLKQDCGDDYCDAWGANYCKGGDVYHSRTCYDKGCSASACFSNPWTDEQLVETCTYGCENNACVIPVCVKNSDCGTDGWVGGLSCSNDDVYQNYRTYTCNNPGTSSSYCSSTDTLTLKQDCGNDYCDAFGGNYCKDGDVYHKRTCYDKGCSAGACFNNPWTDEQLAEDCLYGCQNAKCLLAATVNIPTGVSIFSLPLVPVGGTISFNGLDSGCTVLINGINSSCTGPNLAYLNPDTGAYICVGLDNPLYPGQGYFIKVAGACSFTIIGANLPSSQIGYLGTGVIKRGENLIGAPTNPVSFAAIKGSCSIPEDPLMFVYGATTCTGTADYSGKSYCGTSKTGYNYCYCSVSTLKPGFGYNVYSFNQCSFI